jgi:hypothetical protein
MPSVSPGREGRGSERSTVFCSGIATGKLKGLAALVARNKPKSPAAHTGQESPCQPIQIPARTEPRLASAKWFPRTHLHNTLPCARALCAIMQRSQIAQPGEGAARSAPVAVIVVVVRSGRYQSRQAALLRGHPANPRLRSESWLSGMDSNHDKELQRLLCYHYTTGQDRPQSSGRALRAQRKSACAAVAGRIRTVPPAASRPNPNTESRTPKEGRIPNTEGRSYA